MEEVPESQIQIEKCLYLSRHEVLNEKSSTTKLRVVFNASQKSYGGKSPNGLLQVGPMIQTDLLRLLVEL